VSVRTSPASVQLVWTPLAEGLPGAMIACALTPTETAGLQVAVWLWLRSEDTGDFAVGIISASSARGNHISVRCSKTVLPLCILHFEITVLQKAVSTSRFSVNPNYPVYFLRQDDAQGIQSNAVVTQCVLREDMIDLPG